MPNQDRVCSYWFVTPGFHKRLKTPTGCYLPPAPAAGLLHGSPSSISFHLKALQEAALMRFHSRKEKAKKCCDSPKMESGEPRLYWVTVHRLGVHACVPHE